MLGRLSAQGREGYVGGGGTRARLCWGENAPVFAKASSLRGSRGQAGGRGAGTTIVTADLRYVSG